MHLDQHHGEDLHGQGVLEHLQQFSRLAADQDRIDEVVHAALDVAVGDEALAPLDLVLEVQLDLLVAHVSR